MIVDVSDKSSVAIPRQINNRLHRTLQVFLNSLKKKTLLVIRRLALFNMVYWNKGLYYHGLETRKIKNERVKTKKKNKEMISCRSHQSWFVLFMLLTRFYSCKQFIHVVSLGTRIAQSFGIPKTAEELGFFRLQL